MDFIQELIKEHPLQEEAVMEPAFTVNAVKWRRILKKMDPLLEDIDDLLTTSDKLADMKKIVGNLDADVSLVDATKKAFDKFYDAFRDLEQSVGIAIQTGGDEE